MIALKAYIREIENLIDQGQFQEAINHCKFILSKYPKYIEVYRNFGKALLEQKKFSEAEDVFSRVLSAFPDDFLAHAGLSIVAEEQKNLDLAIWHMELAFDVQPSNVAIQDELRRLFKLRDGNSPAKIRLTHGALVRMYARGELFQQAITEIKPILLEDPKRIDLEILLTRMIYLSGDQAGAEKKCLDIIKKIPYCFEANQLLEKLFLQRNDTEGAEVFRKRLISIDPYYQFVQFPLSETDVPEHKLLIERLNEKDATYDSQMNTDVDGESEPFLFDVSTEEIDWLEPIDKNMHEKKPSNQKQENQDDKETIAQNLEKPEEKDPYRTIDAFYSFENGRPVVNHDQELDNIQEKTNSRPPNVEDKPQSNLESFFSELSEDTMSNGSGDIQNNDHDAFPPSDWLSQFSDNEQKVDHEKTQQDLPDWLNASNVNSSPTNEGNDDLPSWLKDLQSEVEPDSTTQSNESLENNTEISFEKDSILESFLSTEELKSDAKNESLQHLENDGWEKITLNESTFEEKSDVEQSNINNELTESEENRIPDWVNSVLLSDAAKEKISEKDFSDINSRIDRELDFQAQENFEGSDPSESENGLISQQTNDELLDWLRGLKTVEGNETENQSDISSEIPSTRTDLSESKQTVMDQVDTDESITERASKILENQKLSTKKDDTLHDDIISGSDLSLEKELEMLFSQPKVDENSSMQSIQNEPKSSTSPSVENNVTAQTDTNEIIMKMETLLENQDYAMILETFYKYIDMGHSFDFLIECLRPENEVLHADFAYWQMMGDIFTKGSRYQEALSAYQESEALLKNSIKK